MKHSWLPVTTVRGSFFVISSIIWVSTYREQRSLNPSSLILGMMTYAYGLRHWRVSHKQEMRSQCQSLQIVLVVQTCTNHESSATAIRLELNQNNTGPPLDFSSLLSISTTLLWLFDWIQLFQAYDDILLCFRQYPVVTSALSWIRKHPFLYLTPFPWSYQSMKDMKDLQCWTRSHYVWIEYQRRNSSTARYVYISSRESFMLFYAACLFSKY